MNLPRVRIDHVDILTFDASRLHYGGDTVNVVAPWITIYD